METHRRSWLRQRTDASPHTSYLFQFLKSAAFLRRCRCAVARQKRNSKLLRSFRQPPRFFISRCRRRFEPASSHPVLQPASAARGRILLSRFWPSTPSNVLFFEVLATCRTSSFAARLSTGAHCEGGASYCLVAGRQAPRIFYFRGVDDRSNQLLRSPSFNRRLLRRGRILLFGYRASTPRVNFFSSAFRLRKTWLFLRHAKTVFRGRRVNLQEPQRGSKNFF